MGTVFLTGIDMQPASIVMSARSPSHVLFVFIGQPVSGVYCVGQQPQMLGWLPSRWDPSIPQDLFALVIPRYLGSTDQDQVAIEDVPLVRGAVELLPSKSNSTVLVSFV